MDVSTFLTDYFEFAETDPSLVERAIARATRWVDAGVWGDKADDGIGVLTAHFLALANQGSNEKAKAGESTAYWEMFVEMRTSVVAGFAAGGTGGCAPPGWY